MEAEKAKTQLIEDLNKMKVSNAGAEEEAPKEEEDPKVKLFTV